MRTQMLQGHYNALEVTITVTFISNEHHGAVHTQENNILKLIKYCQIHQLMYTSSSSSSDFSPRYQAHGVERFLTAVYLCWSAR